MHTKAVVLGGCLMFAAPLAAMVSAAETCGSLYDEIQAAGGQHTVDGLKAYYRRSLATSDCTDAFKKALGRRVAVAIARTVDTALASGQPVADQEAALVESLTYHRLWQVLATLGDIAQERQDFAGAAQRYQQSLAALSDPATTKLEPSPSTIAAIFRKAETSRLLSPRYVPAPSDNAGAPSGLAAVVLRSFAPKSVALPVAFEPGTFKLTIDGQRAVADMINQLVQQGSPGILLVAHTAGGSDNDLLSEQQAHAVRRIMIEAGYGGAVQSQGLGDRQPFEPGDASRYTKQQRDRMNTRVELRR